MRRIPIRKSSSPDVGRLSAGLARPGMDTRVWSSLAYAAGDSVALEDGVFVDVVLLPTGESLTARVPSEYAGKGFGLYSKIYKNDELLVEVPRGDPAEGPVVSRRLWNKRHAPPQEAQDEPEDVVLVVQKDKTLRLITSGSGKVFVKSGDTVTLETDKVRLGAEDATEAVVLGTTWRAKEAALHTTLQAQFAVLIPLITTAGASLTTAGPLTMLPPAGVAIAAAGASLTSSVAAFTAMNAAIAQYEAEVAAAQNVLSTISKTK